MLCSPWLLCLSTPPLCLSTVGRHRAGVCYVLHGRYASLHTLVSVYSGSLQSRRVLCSPWSLCLSTPPLCLSKVGRHRAGACAMLSMVVVPLCDTHPFCLSAVGRYRAGVCYVLHGRVPLYTTLVSFHSGSSQSRRVLCSPWSLCLSTPPLCLSTVGRQRAGVCYVLHGRCASLHHPCVCLQWVVTEQACAMFSMVTVPLYTTLVSVCSGSSQSRRVSMMFSMVTVPLYTTLVSVCSESSQSRRVLCSPWSLCLSTPPLCLSNVGRYRAGVCYVLHGRCASLHHPCVCLQWVVTEQACAMFSMVVVPPYTTLVSVYSGSSQSRRVLCSPWSLCLSTQPLCLSAVSRHRAGVCYVLHGRCASLQFKLLLLVYRCTHQLAPAYLTDLVVPYFPARSLRSTEQNLLVVKRYNLERYGRRSFSVAGPSLWNALPSAIRNSMSLPAFRSSLKTHLFREAFVTLL